MDRRAFVAGTLALLAAPVAAGAQAVGKARIGYLSGNPSPVTEKAVDAFRAKLRDLGHVEGPNLDHMEGPA